MTDRELLEAAARAADYEVALGCNDSDARVLDPNAFYMRDQHGFRQLWNPLTDDGDALRLAVKLELTELWFSKATGRPEVVCGSKNSGAGAVCEPLRNDPYAATRRAIVRAAAALASTQPTQQTQDRP